MGFSFDEIAAKEAAIQQIFDLLLEPNRLNRIIQSKSLGETDYIRSLSGSINLFPNLLGNFNPNSHKTLCRTLFVKQLIRVYHDARLNELSKMVVFKNLRRLWNCETPVNSNLQYQFYLYQFFTEGFQPESLEKRSTLPPGSPIGMGCTHFHN